MQSLDGNLFSADNSANRVGVILTNNGQPSNIVGGIVAYLIRPDEATLIISGQSSSNRAWVDLPASAYVKVGPFSLVIKNGTTTIGACTGYIYRSTTDEIVDPGHVIPSIEELLAEIENMRSATRAANAAVETANTAAENADTKAAAANTAAGAANTAASNANAKASAANTAASAANTAATNANSKASAANTAASAANTAAANADAKATAANTAATNANEKASAANTAAANANAKASAADTAATNANEKASAANTAAGAANAAAGKIDNMTVAANGLNPGSNPTAEISEVSGHKHILFGIPRGNTGATPDIAVGTVTTLQPNQQATVELDQSSTPEAPVFNFGIPKGDTGTLQNAYASTLEMSPTDSRKIGAVIDTKTDKDTDAVEGNFAAFDANGNPVDSGHKHSDYLTQHQDISGKADKDADAVEGNFASFDANGNPVDSGHKHSDYLTQHQDISGKADKDTDAVTGNFASFDANGNPVDSGHKHSDYLTQHQDISGKADKDTDAVAGNFASFDANGNPVDSGHKHLDYLTQHQDISGKADKDTDAVAGNFASFDGNGNPVDSGNKSSDYIKTINGRLPNPVTGDIVVIEGGGSSSYGAYRIDATIAVSDWVLTNGVYRVTITSNDMADIITSNMDGSETWLDDETAMLGETTFTTFGTGSGDGGIYVDTTVLPTASWGLHILLAMNGADVLSDMTGKIEDAKAIIGSGISIIVDGDTATSAIAPGEYAYIKNNTHGLAEGVYYNSSSSSFPVSGGTANSSVFSIPAKGGLNQLQNGQEASNSKISDVRNYIELGNVSSKSDLDNSMSNLIANNNLLNGKKLARFGCNATFAPFIIGVSYFIDLSASSTNYASAIIQGIGYPQMIQAIKVPTGWSYELIAVNSNIENILQNFSVTLITNDQQSTTGLLYGRIYLVVLTGSTASGSVGSVYLFLPGYSTSKLFAITEGSNKATVDSTDKNKLNYTWGQTSNGGAILRLV